MTQPLLKNDFFNIITLSVPIFHKKSTGLSTTGLRTAIASSIIVEAPLSFTESDFLKRMMFLNIRKMTLVVVHDSDGDITPRVMSAKNNESEEFVLTHNFIRNKTFFSHNCFEYYFDSKRKNSAEFIYAFENLNWRKLCLNFATTGIDISGGSNTKKHLLSPLQFRLSQFLICSLGDAAASTTSANFHSPREPRDKKLIEYALTKTHDDIKNLMSNNVNLIDLVCNNNSLTADELDKFLKPRDQVRQELQEKLNIESQNTDSAVDNKIVRSQRKKEQQAKEPK